MDLMFKYHTFGIEKIRSLVDEFMAVHEKDFDYFYMFGKSNLNLMTLRYIEKKYGKTGCGVLDNNKAIKGNPVSGEAKIIYAPEVGEPRQRTVVIIFSSYTKEQTQQLEELGWKEGKNVFPLMNIRKNITDFSPFGRTIEPIDAAESLKVQKESMVYLKNICDKENIPYTLAYGTLLGAVRHKGFIPWDDDVDMHVMGADIDRLIETVNGNDDPYQIISVNNSPGYIYNHCLLINTNYIKDRLLFPIAYTTGLSIDIWPLWSIPEDEIEHKKVWEHYKSLRSEVFDSLFLGEGDINEGARSSNRFLAECCKEDSKYIGCLYSMYYLKDKLNRKWFDGFEELLFEGELFKAPIGYHDYLTTVYGDYMTPPPVKDREKKFHSYRAYRK